VHGDASATVQNILGSEFLFRAGIFVGAIGNVVFLILPFVLYKLLSQVDRNVAVLMVAFAVSFVPIGFVAIANQLDVLTLLDGDKYLRALGVDQLNARVMLLLSAYNNRILVSEIFWGLWLAPFGYLVYRSGFLPKLLGALLMLGCLGYLISFFTQILFPNYETPSFVMWPATFGEIGICLWLLIMGARRSIRRPG
jgi:hypothetical protein